MRNTPNYNLPQYEGTDKFTKEVLNDAFNKVDTAINDLQETFNINGSTSTLTTQEVVNARNGKQNLKERIDEIDEQYKDIVTNDIPQLQGQVEHMTNSKNKEFSQLGEELVNSTGWISNGWTGDFTSGFTHIVGQTTPLTKDIGSTGIKFYEVEFTITSPTSDYDVDVSIGNSIPFELYTGVGTTKNYKIGIKSVSDGVLSFSPKSTFNGNISNISVREVIESYEPTYAIKDSTGVNGYEIRSNLDEQKNVFIGKDVGGNNYSGYDNVGVGHSALVDNVGGFWNIGVGTMALNANVGGSRNVGIGFNALRSNICGQRNQAIGSWALQSNINGIRNVAIGSDCMFQNVSGSQNISLGMASMYYNKTGSKNVAIGDSALNKVDSDQNIGIGYFAGKSITTGSYNIAIGGNSLNGNVTGSNNIAIGHQSLMQTTTDSNIAIGKDTQYNAISGARNISIGDGALKRNVTGSNNIAIGYQSCQSTSGQNINNIISIGYQSGYNLTEGASNNILIGYRSGFNVSSGVSNVLIGYNVQTPTPETNNYFSLCDIITGNVSTKAIIIPTIRTTDPKVIGQLWNDNGTLKISQG